MKILLTLPVPGLETTDFLRSGNVVHAPLPDAASGEELLDALLLHRADALITARRPDDRVLRRWAHHVPGAAFLAAADAAPRPRPPAGGGVAESPLDGGGVEAVAAALARCERAAASALPSAAAADGRPREVVLVGAGVVNLVTAVYLAEEGHRVTVLDRSPEPGGADWRAHGSTHAGDAARMFTLTEMDGYNNQDVHGTAPAHFRRTVERGGWLARDPWTLSAGERAWIEEFESVPSWLARAYNQDIFSLSAQAAQEWALLRRRRPELFEDVVLTDGVLRVYSDPGHLAAALSRHRAIGAAVRELTPGRLAREVPALAAAALGGTLAGGLVVPGFTLDVHRFCARLVAWLRARGAAFHWGTEVAGVRRDASGTVTGLDCPVPLPRGAHVVASPGVYGGALLRGTPCENAVHGVLGGWVRVAAPSPGPAHSLKVARRGHVTEDANVTVGRDGDGREVLIVGSGYGYTGTAAEPDARQLAALRSGIADTVERLFPGRPALPPSSRARDNYGFKYCVRPWTATSLGVYHAEHTADGGLFVLDGGHNTGGFAQSPAIARAVLASLAGRAHPMHTLYHPRRFAAFTAGARPTATPPPPASRGFGALPDRAARSAR